MTSVLGNPVPTIPIIEEFGTEITWEILGTENGWYVWAHHRGETEDDSFKFQGRGDTLADALISVAEELHAIGPEWVHT